MSADEFVIIDLTPKRDTEVDVGNAVSILGEWGGWDESDPHHRPPTWRTPPDIAKAWVAGLRAAGATGVRTAFLPAYKISLPMVVELDCPFWHDGEIEGSFAKVRLLIDRAGWFSHYRGLRLGYGDEQPKFNTGSCPQCAKVPDDLLAWLLTCPACAAEESVETHPEHTRFFDYCECPDRDEEGHRCPPSTDASPFARVLDVISGAAQPGRRVVDDDEPRGKWTAETAARWLDDQTDEDGAPLVPISMGQKPAWALVRDIEGRPTQTAMRKGQELRQSRKPAP